MARRAYRPRNSTLELVRRIRALEREVNTKEADTLATVEQAIRLTMDPEGRVMSLATLSDGTHGLVIWKRKANPVEYVTHRWATHLTDGSPVSNPGGVMFYSGGYYRTLEEAGEDMKERAR